MIPASSLSIPVSFPMLRSARQKFDFDAPSFTEFALARELAVKINATRDLKTQPARAVRSGRLAAAALLNEIFAHVIALYLEEVEPAALEEAPSFIEGNVGELSFAQLLAQLQDEFGAPSSRPEATEYALRLRLANLNPAFSTFAELFDDSTLVQPAYENTFVALDAYFQTLPPFGDEGLSLWHLLLQPIRLHPDSVDEQLRFILGSWTRLVEPFASRLLVHLDVIREEEKPTFFGPGPALVPDYARAVGADEYEAFTQDRDWMPRVVLLAKQTYVWLDQLSKKYERHIYRFDQVPDEELDEMASRGFTGLWLIGVWQRSHASQRIKQMTGNPDAIASAYSLYSYDIAWELGGHEAMEDLKQRAAARGIRVASDMVPNHMAIDSKWVVEHPEWFLSLPYPPFPNSDFDGPDLCDDESVGVFLENGYYTKTDASVVFKRVDYQTGDTSYIYHGNDGTSFPWNDTAQLDYLIPEVREAVMQVILAVARQFPIIRFDAAMTLAKRHIHRLWFPSPGSGGDIPSRAGRGLSPDEFDAAMPNEFWREVVDRIAVEAPDTLLLAEAFWMMEGYFVRTLGMHRVYNSAFMNMLRDEKNADYRLTLKNTLEFDPDILGRFVNFMNNPDEKTAVEQFGKADKYFGVSTLLATLPGLPMFGHGQIEGYAEKYGMEYPRAYWDETPDEPFIAHHKRVIFPLLHKRALFASSENFNLYDFWSGQSVNEDVFAYSNSNGDEKALIVYNNCYAEASGWIKTSVAAAKKHADGSKTLEQHTLGEALSLSTENRCWTIFRENTSDLEYLRRSHEVLEKGLFVALQPYGCQVFLEWREVRDESGLYERLAARLDGGGVPSVDIALKEMLLEPLLGPWKALCDPSTWQEAFEGDATVLEARGRVFAASVANFLGKEVDSQAFVTGLREWAHGHLEEGLLAATEPVAADVPLEEVLPDTAPVVPVSSPEQAVEKLESGEAEASTIFAERATLLAYAILKQLGEASGENLPQARARVWLDEWLLVPTLEVTLQSFGAAPDALANIRLWLSHCNAAPSNPFAFLSKLLADAEVQRSLGINNWENTLWFQGEGLDSLLETLELGAALEGIELPLPEIASAADEAGFRVVKWMENVRNVANRDGALSPLTETRAPAPRA